MSTIRWQANEGHEICSYRRARIVEGPFRACGVVCYSSAGLTYLPSKVNHLNMGH